MNEQTSGRVAFCFCPDHDLRAQTFGQERWTIPVELQERERFRWKTHPQIAQHRAGVQIRGDEEALAAGVIASKEGVEPMPARRFAGQAAEVLVAHVGCVEAEECTVPKSRLASQPEEAGIEGPQILLLLG